MSCPFRIRAAVPEDSEAAVRVVRSVFDEYGFTWDQHDYNADLHDLKVHYLDLGNYFWVAELFEDAFGMAKYTVVGTTALETYPQLPGEFGERTEAAGKVRVAGSDCSLERLYVHPQARGARLGTALLLTSARRALEIGREVMEIWSDKKLTMAHALYAKFGAVLVGDRICDDPDQSWEWGMALRITPELVAVLESGILRDEKLRI